MIFSIGRFEYKGDKDGNVLGSNDIIIIIFLFNIFMIFMVCCIIGFCVYYKRKLIFSRIFEVKDGNKYKRNMLYVKWVFFKDVLLYK